MLGRLLLALLVVPVALRALPADEIAGGLTNLEAVLGARGIVIPPDGLQRATQEAVLRAHDPGAAIVDPAGARRFAAERDGETFQGGLRLGLTNGWPVVRALDPNGPAMKAGLATGDVIEAFGGNDARWMGLYAAAARFRAATGGVVTADFRRGSVRSNAVVQLARAALPAGEPAERLPGGILYLRIHALRPGAEEPLLAALAAVAVSNTPGVVMDLRHAAGTGEVAAVAVAGRLAAVGERIGSWRSADGQEVREIKPVGDVGGIGVPVMALVDHQTRGAAELLAVLMAGSLRGAMVIGTATAGDPLIREELPLPDGQMAIVATRKLVTGDGTVCDGHGGVSPDIVIDPRRPQLPFYEPDEVNGRPLILPEELVDLALRERVRGDEALQRAVDVLLGLRALNLRGPAPDAARAK
jgi:C-terminal processing protease CtpA/Prc